MGLKMREILSCTDRLWVLNEDLGLAKLVLVLVHVDSTHQMIDSLLHVTSPLRPGLRRQNSVPEHHVRELVATHVGYMLVQKNEQFMSDNNSG